LPKGVFLSFDWFSIPANEQPERLKKLKAAWDQYADEVGVVLYDD